MRTRQSNRIELKNKVLSFLKSAPDGVFNISEISRAVDKAPPTITKVVEELEKEKKITILNKKSMRLIKINNEGDNDGC
jgi:predicted transcriptional regulator with HTH domain